jgi:NADH dehydrogenase [ubiquinone] 1 alpha subcomplex assembly factor 3
VINNIVVKKPVLLLPQNFLIWNTLTFEEIDVKSLSLFTYLYPTLEILIVGCGKTSQNRLPREVREYFQLRGIVIEQMDSVNAAQTFNVLISEGRNVGAAIIPPFPIPEEEFDPSIFN